MCWATRRAIQSTMRIPSLGEVNIGLGPELLSNPVTRRHVHSSQIKSPEPKMCRCPQMSLDSEQGLLCMDHLNGIASIEVRLLSIPDCLPT